MNTYFSTSIEFIETTDDGEQFLSSTIFPNAYGDTAKESEANAIAGFEKAGHTVDELMSITTVELEK